MNNPDLNKFCSEILMAIDGKVIPHWFLDGFALCTNAGRYDQAHDTFVYETLDNIFKGDPYPFNRDQSDYIYERCYGMIYVNKRRMAFLKKYAKKLKWQGLSHFPTNS